MGDLLSYRVSEIKPFSVVRVNDGGFFVVTYACSSAFLQRKSTAKLRRTFPQRRFIARRGRCSVIYCDCGTNLIGAQKQPNVLMKQAADSNTH